MGRGRKKRDDHDIDIEPLIDMVFILLICFARRSSSTK